MIGVWTGMILIAAAQVPVLVKKKQQKELIAFVVIWAIAGIYASLIFGTNNGQVAITNITELLIRFFTVIYDRLGIGL
jgi:hypothetical protein